MAVGGTSGSTQVDPQQRYEQLRAQYEQVKDAHKPHGLREHLLPHESDGWLIRAMKIGIPAALGLAAIGGGLTGIGKLAGSQALQGAGSLAITGGVFIGAAAVLPGMLGPFLHAMPGAFRKDHPDVVAAYDAMQEAYGQTPEVVARDRERVERYETAPLDVVREHLVDPYDHDGNGTVTILRPQTILEDERVRDPNGGPLNDLDENAISALPTLRAMDVDGSGQVEPDEQEAWGASFDEDGSTRLDDAEVLNLQQAIRELKVDDYRDLDSAPR